MKFPSPTNSLFSNSSLGVCRGLFFYMDTKKNATHMAQFTKPKPNRSSRLKKPNPFHINKRVLLNQTKGFMCWVQQQQPTSLHFIKIQQQSSLYPTFWLQKELHVTLARDTRKGLVKWFNWACSPLHWAQHLQSKLRLSTSTHWC